ncbi:MAG: TolC family protein [Acidobacteria bacterium]|nr:MAG: TolC family protein [Acidobacteriota bacterium]
MSLHPFEMWTPSESTSVTVITVVCRKSFENMAMRFVKHLNQAFAFRQPLAAVSIIGNLAILLALLLPPSLKAQTKAPAPAGPLSLPQAVDIALKHNPSVHAATAYADAARHAIDTARAGYLPQLNFSEGVTRGNNPVYVFGTLLTQRQFTAANFDLGFLNVPPPLDNFRTQFAASMSLYDFGRTSDRVRNARIEAQGGRSNVSRTEQNVVFDVIKAYLSGLLAREQIRVAEAAVAMAKADLQRAQAREQQGLAVASDVLSAQAQLAQAGEDLVRAQNAEAISLSVLNVAMGLPEDAPTQTDSKLATVQAPAEDLSSLQKQALKQRPDYHEAQLQAEQAGNSVSLARKEFLPRIDLMGSWELDNQTFASRGGNNWIAGATLTFNIFNGGARLAQIAQSRAYQQRAEAMRSQTESAVRLQVREAYLNLNAARQRVEVSRDAAAQAEESLRILQNRYGEGLATIMDVLRAETMRTSAQNNHLNAVYDLRLAVATLELATGALGPGSPAVTQ